MRRNHGARNLVRRLSAFVLGVVVVLCAASMVSAADYIPKGQPIPQGIRWTNATSSGANTSAWATWTDAMGKTSSHKFPVPVGSDTIGKLFRGAVRRGGAAAGWYFAAKSIIDAAGWAINELQGQVTTPEIPPEELTGGQYWCAKPGLGGFELPATYCTATAQAMASFLMGKTVIGNGAGEMGKVVTETVVSGTNVIARSIEGGSLVASVTVPRIVTLPPNYMTPGSQPAVPISDYDVGQLLKQHPEIVNAVLVDPDTGAPIRTNELIDALNDLMRKLEAANGVQVPAPDMVADPDLTDPETTPSQQEWPAFCDWATTVCDWINWTKETEPLDEVEVPWEEAPIVESTWTSGFGGGSCPQPVSFSVSLGGYLASPTFEYQPICQFATTMRPVVYAISLIVAAFIVAGLRNNKGA